VDRVTDTRLTLRQAAAVLGVSESAVRKRVERATLRSDKGADGRRYVYLDVPEPGADSVADEGADTSATGERDALISAKEETIAVLREQLDAERAAHAEARRLLAAALERIPAIEAPATQETAEDADTVEEEPERAAPRSDATGPQESAQRPWWRRVFGS
jgi:hypothetical protein